MQTAFQADAFSVELKDSAGAVSQSVLLGLAANAQTQLKFTRKLTKALETFTFTIDPDNRVNDSDRSNNVFKLEVRAEAAPAEVQEYALIYSPNLSTCPSVLAVKPGDYEIVQGETIVGRLTTQFKEEIFDGALSKLPRSRE